MSTINLSDKNSARLQQLFSERQKMEELLNHTILTIVDASNIEYAPTDKISVAQDFKSINIDREAAQEDIAEVVD